MQGEQGTSGRGKAAGYESSTTGSRAGAKPVPGMGSQAAGGGRCRSSPCCSPMAPQARCWHQGHSREGSCMQQHPESHELSPMYCDTDEVAQCHGAKTHTRGNAARYLLHQLPGFAPWAKCPTRWEHPTGATCTPAHLPALPAAGAAQEQWRAGQGWVLAWGDSPPKHSLPRDRRQ